MVGQRWDTLIDHWSMPSGPQWWAETNERSSHPRASSTRSSGSTTSVSPPGSMTTFPRSSSAGPGYDNWLVWRARHTPIPIVDASLAVTAVHQRHDYAQYGGTKNHVWTEDAQRNADLIGDRRRLYTIGHATHRLDGAASCPPGARSTPWLAHTLIAGDRFDRHGATQGRSGRELVQRMTTPLRRRQQGRLVGVTRSGSQRGGARRRPSRRHIPTIAPVHQLRL